MNILDFEFFSVFGAPDGFTSVQVGPSLCYYVSTKAVWPYPNGVANENAAKDTCAAMNLDLATLASDAEKLAFWSLLSKTLNIF
jgi:hypothetical protein